MPVAVIDGRREGNLSGSGVSAQRSFVHHRRPLDEQLSPVAVAQEQSAKRKATRVGSQGLDDAVVDNQRWAVDIEGRAYQKHGPTTYLQINRTGVGETERPTPNTKEETERLLCQQLHNHVIC